MGNYRLRFLISCDYGRFSYDLSISQELWCTAGRQHDIIWESGAQAVISCFRPEWQDAFYRRRIKREMEFVVTVEPLLDGNLGMDRKSAMNQPDSLKRYWGAKRTFIVKTALDPVSVKLKGTP